MCRTEGILTQDKERKKKKPRGENKYTHGRKKERRFPHRINKTNDSSNTESK